MKKIISLSIVLFLYCFLFETAVYSQIGIGTVTPDLSSVLDVSSTTKGMLTPRMTTVERTAIATPADGLIVYDTTLKSFYYYNSSTVSWVILNSGANGRLKFKRIKSTDVLATVLAAEKLAGGANYKLDSGTYYEINGSINFDAPIELNNAYLVGLDANEDRLIRSAGLFVGSTGGTIKNLLVQTSGGPVFALNGTGNVESLLFRDCIVTGCASVGSIENFGLVFFSVVQYSGNTTGITYNNITRLLLSNTAWFGNNAGTFEKFTGTFSFIQKQGGFCEVNGSAIGVDVSTAGLNITGSAVMETVVFAGTNTTGYVKGYSPVTYTGYNFNNSWYVRCAGIPNEADAFATGTLYLNRALTLPTLSVVSPTTFTKVPGTTIATNLYRMSNGATNNRLVYSGTKTREFTVTASVSFDAGGSGVTDYVFFFVKWNASGTTSTDLTSTQTFIDTNSGFVQSFPVTGTVTLNTGEYVELCVRRITGTDKTLSFKSYNMSIK